MYGRGVEWLGHSSCCCCGLQHIRFIAANVAQNKDNRPSEPISTEEHDGRTNSPLMLTQARDLVILIYAVAFPLLLLAGRSHAFVSRRMLVYAFD